MHGLSASGLADLAGTTTAEVQQLIQLGILVPRDGPDPFQETDAAKIRLAAACQQAGLPAHVGIAAGAVVIQGGDYYGRTVNLAAPSPPTPTPARSWSPRTSPKPPHPTTPPS